MIDRGVNLQAAWRQVIDLETVQAFEGLLELGADIKQVQEQESLANYLLRTRKCRSLHRLLRLEKGIKFDLALAISIVWGRDYEMMHILNVLKCDPTCSQRNEITQIFKTHQHDFLVLATKNGDGGMCQLVRQMSISSQSSVSRQAQLTSGLTLLRGSVGERPNTSTLSVKMGL